MWITTQELLGLPEMPSTTQGINFRAKQENWQRRRKEGVKGNVYEYHLTSLPPETQQQLKLKAAMAAVPNTEWDTPKPNAQLVSRLNQATDKQREKAKAKAEAVLKLKDYLALDFPLAQALHCGAAQKSVSAGSLKNWYYKVIGHPVHEWLALLAGEWINGDGY